MEAGPHAVAPVLHTSVPRRAFLLGAGASLVAAACGRGTKLATDETASPSGALSFMPAVVELAVGDERLAFGVFRGDAPVLYTRGASGRLRLRDPKGGEPDPARLRTFPIVRSAGGEDAERATEQATLVLVARVPFDAPGRWDVLTEVDLGGAPQVVAGRLDVLETSRTIGPGVKAVNVATPTTQDARGVDPICTRNPPCTMHDLSLDEALRSGKPTVAVFATPALCESRMCGPDVDIVEKAHLRRRNDANFIHVEIYKDQTGREFAPATAAWSIDKAGEPWVFFLSPDGVVSERLSGPVGEWEVDEGVARLARS